MSNSDTVPKAAGTPLESAARLRPAQLVELLERLDPADPKVATLDVNGLAAAVDPRKLGTEAFVRLLGALDRLAEHNPEVDLSRIDAHIFARLVHAASADQLSALTSHARLRGRVLDEVFRRMTEHFRPARAATTRAVVHWRLSEGAGSGGFDRYETVIEDGTCVINRERTRDARVTITMPPAEFLRLVTGNASVAALFMTGKLRVRGDLAFAAGLTSLFDLPKP